MFGCSARGRNVRAFRTLQEREGIERPLVSLWLTGLKETIRELPAFVRIAADLGVREVYLQRLVFFDQAAIGIARPDQALFENMTRDEAVYLKKLPIWPARSASPSTLQARRRSRASV